jgi:hypothetical protein
MGTILASVLIDAVAKTLQDETNVKWARTELLGYLNDGQREVVMAKPDAYATNAALQLVAGSKQTIPASGFAFQRMNCNLGVSGTAYGRAPRHIDIKILDEQIPGWRGATAGAEVLHYTFAEADPKRFYVYPPQPSSGMTQVEIVYSSAPPDVASESTALTLDDIYKTPLMKYMEYRAYSKDAEYAREDAAAMAAYKVFGLLIGLREKADDDTKASR